ncbi:Pathogen-related protein [Ananas comosus]|uniref:Pathogen-related protein n=1 Tax=Ananas comosus TaxID=4615 RepID=A0A199VHG2_ANACO|nr:Pathogen-related protein [Ananas comosus]
MASAEVEGDKYRSFIYGESEKNTVWRDGAPPNYDVVNKLFEEGRTQEWPVGSLEEKVQRLVKTWEMEMVHKIRPQDWKTINPDKFRFSVNGAEEITAKQIGERGGSYNVFLQTTLPPELRVFDPAQESTETSQATFTTAFPRGFALEILQVYSGPPKIVDDENRVEKVEFFYERGDFLSDFLKGAPIDTSLAAQSSCPFLK